MYVYFTVLFAVISSTGAGNNYGVDETVLNELKGAKSKAETASTFMEKLWPTMVGYLIPEAAIVLPAVEIDVDDVRRSDIDENHYTCATETVMYPKLTTTVKPLFETITKLKLPSIVRPWSMKTYIPKGRIVITIDVHLEFSKSLQFKLAQKSETNTIPRTPVNLQFVGRNVVRIVFSIPDFSQKQVPTAKCLVKMIKTEIKDLGSIRFLNEEEITQDQKLGDIKNVMLKKYCKAMKEKYPDMVSMGLTNAVTEKFRNGDSWICISHIMAESESDYKRKYIKKNEGYYKKYCIED